ncbi:MAG: pyridoxal phosphate-dependent aminotransferase [Thermoproteales archaeon]|nr:pyridoxal phosphate-dependent aminotransferase [Thermoproteales archaeon]
MPYLSDRIELIRISPIRMIAALLDKARASRSIISFGGGAPSLPPPRELLEEIENLIREKPIKALGYCGTRGLPELRDLIAEDLKKYTGVEYDGEKEIMITDGSTEGIFLTFLSILNKNDEVILIDPTYLGYTEPIKLAGGRIVRIPAKVENGYQPDPEDLKNSVTKRTRAFVLLSPDNPTGRVISREFVKTLVDLAQEHDFWIIYDGAYQHIVYEGENTWPQSYPGAKEYIISVHTFSKEASIPGLRVGYVAAPKEVISAMEKLKQYTSLAPNTFAQYALLKFYENGVKERYLRNVVIPTYKSRRDLMGELIRKYLPEARTITPHGAFYFFVDIRPYLELMGRNDKEFASRLLYRKEVVVIPGSYFGSMGNGHVRMTFVSESEERIKEGIERIWEFVFSYTI